MILIINTSNIVIGGGIQVSLSIIHELKKYSENEYHIFLSKKMSLQICKSKFSNNFYFYDTPISPSSVKTRRKVVKQLNFLENKIKPDVVFTVFGPSYWKPNAIHLSGFADGWCYNPNSIAFNKLNLKERIIFKLRIAYKNYYLKKTSSYLVVETEIAKKNIIEYLGFKSSKIFVVGNTCSNFFSDNKEIKHAKDKNTFKLITISAFYKHKNLEIINDVVKILKQKSSVNFKFYLTIDDKTFLKTFKRNSNIINLGSQEAFNCPSLYLNSDAMFLPTLLETFTASYPEAMQMKIPIITSNLDFANNICGDAALYFNPLDPNEIADKIITLAENNELYFDLISKGEKRLKKFETANSRTIKYLRICEDISSKNKSIYN